MRLLSVRFPFIIVDITSHCNREFHPFKRKEMNCYRTVLPLHLTSHFSFDAFSILSLNIFISLKCVGISMFVLSSWEVMGVFRCVLNMFHQTYPLYLQIFYISFYLSAIVILCVWQDT